MLTFAHEKKAAASVRPVRREPLASAAGPSWQAHQNQIRHILRSPKVQPKLTIGAPNDVYEQEADHVADAVMRMPEPQHGQTALLENSRPTIQRLCTECEEEVQRQPIEEERPETIAHRKIQELATSSSQEHGAAVYREMADSSPQVRRDDRLQTMANNSPRTVALIKFQQETMHPQPDFAQRAEVRRILHGPRLQTKLTVGAPDHTYEREADRVADEVMRMAEPSIVVDPAVSDRLRRPQIQHLCPECEEELQRLPIEEEKEDVLQAKEDPGPTSELTRDPEPSISALQGSDLARSGEGPAEVAPGMKEAIESSRGGGHALDYELRGQMESAFGVDFSGIRIHTDGGADRLNRQLHARAFTIGTDIFFRHGEYRTDTASAKKLIAHEMTHVVQQTRSAEPPTLRRWLIHRNCVLRRRDPFAIAIAWADGRDLARQTLNTLRYVKEYMRLPGGADQRLPGAAQAIRNSFGRSFRGLGGNGDVSHISRLIRNFDRIREGFGSQRTVRCDYETVPDHGCGNYGHAAFNVAGNSDFIYLCPSFFDSMSEGGRGVMLLHEMTHSVLNIVHEGGFDDQRLSDCTTPLGPYPPESFRNAYAYSTLADCLHGTMPSAVVRPSGTAP